MLRSCCLFTLFGCIVGPPVPPTSPGQGYPGYIGNNYNGWTPWQNYFNYYLQRYFQKPTKWNNYHAETWDGLCATGKSQSPIDIKTKETSGLVMDDFGLDQFSQWHYGGTTENNGHTLKFTPKQDVNIKISGLKDIYKFAQFHLHWGYTSEVGSEHTIDGKAFPMELHFVHYNSKYKDIGEAIQNEDGLAVLGVLFELSPYDNPNLNPLLNAIPAIQKGHWEAWNTYPQNFRKLLPVDTKSFYRYQGSLTTPPCSEVVTWTVFHDKLPISERQLKALRTLSNYERFYLYSTYRPVQELNGRTVFRRSL